MDRFNHTTFWMPYAYYIEDTPKISDLYLNDQIPDSLKNIANTKSIQNKYYYARSILLQ